MTLYEILGIEKDATPEDIKKAYRHKANKLHPDKKDGDKEKFVEVKEAYEILSDPERRAAYDTDGKAVSGKLDPKERARTEAIEFIAGILEGLVSDDAAEVETMPVLNQVLNKVNENKIAAVSTILLLEKRIAKRNKMLARLFKKDASNSTVHFILQKFNETQLDQILKLKEIIIKMDVVLEVLDTYQYVNDGSSEGFPFTGTFFLP